MKSFLWVFLGGGFGSVCRYFLGNMLNQDKNFLPFGTLTANVLGSFLIGLLLAYAVHSGQHQQLRLAAIVGFCGGFTTMSAFSAESIQLLQTGRYVQFFTYLLLTIVACMGATALGLTFFRQ